MADTGTCRSCGAAILWVKTSSGKSMPLDAEPTADGNILIIEGVAHVMKKNLEKEFAADMPRHKSHFATCPGAAQHRKPR